MAARLTLDAEVLVVHACTDDAQALLQQVLTDLTGRSAHALVRTCATCGGPHGKPVLVDGGLHVSLSSVPDRAVVAVTAAGPVGVDVERLAATGFDGFAGVALGEDETDGDLAHRARTWTRKEAVLKAIGVGLAVDPRTVDVRGRTALGTHLRDVEVSADLACAVAVLCDAPPSLRVQERQVNA